MSASVCRTKIAFASAHEAHQRAEKVTKLNRLAHRHYPPAHVYRCDACGKYHLTSEHDTPAPKPRQRFNWRRALELSEVA